MREAISSLSEQFGLEIYRPELLPIHGGSLELLVGIKGEHPVGPSAGRFLAEEAARGFGNIATYRAFADRVWRIQDKLLVILHDWKDRGKTVHAFGAPAKGATTLNSFGITRELVPLAVERNPLKIGKAIPGSRIPIADEETAPVPDADLILPRNFFAEFLRRKRDYIMAGGAFIVRIPDAVVIDRSNYDRHVG